MAGVATTFTDHSECLALTTLVQTGAAHPLGSRSRRLKRGERMWLSEPPFDRVYRLESGHVSVFGADEGGRELLLRTIGPGEWFGDYCLCPGQHYPHPATEARADDECRVIEVRHERWLRDMAGDRVAIRTFVAQTCVRLAQADRRLIMLARRSADERIGLLLLDYASATPQSADGFGAVSLTHAEIATAAAMSRPHVSVTLGRFRRKGLVQYHRQESIRVDVERLRAYLEQFDAVDALKRG